MKKRNLLLMLLLAIGLPWAANAQKAIPYSYGFEDNNLATDGWTQQTSNSSSGIFSASSSSHGGTYLFRFHYNENPGYLISPLLTGTNNGVDLEFYYANYSSSYNEKFQVGYTTDENVTDPSAFTYLSEITCQTLAPSYTTYENTFPAGTKRIAIKYIYTNGYYLYLDDFSFKVPASCPKPTGLAVSNVTHNEATLSWTENGTATSWQYCLNGDEEHPVTMNTNPYTMTGLTPLTAYTVKVRSVGSTENSAWSNEVSFSTTAVAEAVGDSWSDDFEGTACGWELINGTLTNQWVWGTAVNNGGTHALYVSNDGGATNNYSANSTKIFATKLLNFAEGKYEFTYDWRCKGESTYDFLRVALVPASQTLSAGTDYSTITQPSLPTGWIALDGGKLNLQETWQSKEVTINVAAGNYYLVLAWRNDSGVYPPAASVDNVSITRVACGYDVTDLAAGNITTNSADITWTAGEATGWQVTYKTNEASEWTDNEPVSTNSTTLSGLAASTNYQVKVRAYCGGEDFGSWCQAISFATACGAITNFPWQEDFNSYSTTATSTTAPSSYPNDVMPVCWTFLNRSESTSSYPQAFLSSYSDYAVSGNCLFFKSSSTTPLYAVLPEFGNDIAGLELSFTYRNEGTGTSNGTLYVGYMTDPNDASTFNTENAVACAQTTSKTPMNVVLPNAPAGSYFAFKYQGGSSNNYYLAIDNITVKVPVFVTANQIVNNVSDPATEMTWNEFVNHWTNDDHFTSTTFTLMDDITVSTMVGTSARPFTGIFNGNSHTITVSLTATDNNFTAPFRIIRNATIQNLKVDGTINDDGHKFCAGFAGDCYGNNIFTNCVSDVTINATTEGDGTHGGFIARNYGGSSSSSSSLATTTFNGCAFTGQLLGASTTQVGGFCGWSEYNSPNYSRTVFNNCVFDPSEVTMSTTSAATFARTRNATYMTISNCYFMEDFNDGTNNIGQGKQAYTITGVGNVTVAMAGTHTDYSLSGISAYTNGIVYNNTIYAGGDETVTLDLSGADNYGANHGELSLSGSNYTLTMEAFDTQISAVTCPKPTHLAVTDGSVTNHTAKLTWEGTCASYNVKYRTAAGIRGIEEDFTGLTSGIPTGWDNSEGTSTSSYKWSYNNSGHDAAPCVRFNSYSNSNGNTNFLKTPSMNFPANTTVTLSFWWKNPTGGDFSVYISTDGGSTKTEIATGLTDQSSWKQETFTLTNYVNMGTSNVTIHFKGTSNYGNGDAYIYLDDVVMGYEVAAGEWQYANNIEDEEVTLQGLDPETKYEAYLTGDCSSSGDGYSAEVGPVTFTTDIACPNPTNLQIVENSVKSDRVTLSWESNYANEWVVAYKADGETDYTEVTADENPYTLTGLREETDYVVKVRSNCGSSDGLSNGWTNEQSFTTIAPCSVEEVTIANITHHTATVNWTGESASGFTVKYRTAAGIDGISEEFSNNSIPNDWTQYTGLFDETEGTATLASDSRWYFGSYNGVFNNHARTNNYSTYKAWLVTPRFTVPTGVNFSFDVALTTYSGTNTAVDPTKQQDDKFIVLISTDNKATWTVLRKWDNDASQYVYNDLPATATGLHVSDIDLSTYVGQNVYIAFYTESTDGTGNNGGDNNLHIDNVVIGTPVPAGTEQTVSATDSPANLENLQAGTKYDVKVVPNCDETMASEWQSFTTVSPNEKWFVTEGNWGTASNWEPTGVPTIDQNVTLLANATIESTCVAEAKSINGTGTGNNAYTLTIKDGGKLKHLNSNVRATVEKEIRAYSTNYDEENYNNGDYYLITNPLTSNVTPDAENNYLLSGNYDLYSWDYSASDDNEWRNYEANPKPFTSLNVGAYGYLYANETGATLTYTGTINAYTNSKSRYCGASSSPENYDFPGWYLLGNPYMYDAYLANASSNGTALPYIKMNTTGDGFTNAAAGTPIEPMEGFFYQQATTSGSVYVVTYEPAAPNDGKLNMNLSRANKQLDNAILVFGGDQQLGKMTFRENSSKIFMPVEGKDYAITSVEGQVGEVPVSFKAENNGTYSLSFTSEEVSFSYLHLIDNMTGNDVNLLQTPSYSFDARTTDYESRFKLVFAVGSSANDETFGFVNASGNFCIFGIEGEATVQVIDVLGHVLSSETFSGSYEKQLNVAPGVYMVRLIQGNDVKVQKVVVRR